MLQDLGWLAFQWQQHPDREADAPVSGGMCEYRGYFCKTVSGEGGRSHVTLPFLGRHCIVIFSPFADHIFSAFQILLAIPRRPNAVGRGADGCGDKAGPALCPGVWPSHTNVDGHARPSDVKVLIGTRKTLLPDHNEYMINT